MKKILFTQLLVSVLFATAIFAQDTTAKKGWPAGERTAFIASCFKSANVNLGTDTGRSYCYCMLEKIEKKYPTIEAAATIKSTDMETPEWQKEIMACITGVSEWSTAERTAFLGDCKKTATAGGMGEQKATSYCECMMYKIEKKYPKAAAAAAISSEVLQTPEWKKMVQDCLNFK